MNRTTRILIAEGNRAVSSALRKYLEAAAFTVETVEGLDDAILRLRNFAPDVVVAGVGSLDGEELCRKSREIAATTPVVLVYPPEDDDPDARATNAGAETYLVGPLKRGTVVSCVKGLFKVRALNEKVLELERELEKRISLPVVKTDSRNIVDFEFFKRLLLMEVKRSKRYRYPNSFLLVAVDKFKESVGALEPKAQGKFMGQLLAATTKSVRDDIDLCVPYAEDKFLVFLPHTAIKGATLVAVRLKDRLAAFVADDGSKVTVSIGMAAYDGGGASVSFGGLLKNALDNLKKAQAEGGNRVENGSEAPRGRERASSG